MLLTQSRVHGLTELDLFSCVSRELVVEVDNVSLEELLEALGGDLVMGLYGALAVQLCVQAGYV